MGNKSASVKLFHQSYRFDFLLLSFTPQQYQEELYTAVQKSSIDDETVKYVYWDTSFFRVLTIKH